MELAKLNEWTETQETQEDSASWCSGRGRDDIRLDWAAAWEGASHFSQPQIQNDHRGVQALWDVGGVGCGNGRGAVPPQGQSGDALGLTGGRYHALAERNQSSSPPLGRGELHSTPDRSFWMLPPLPTKIREE